MTNSCTKGKRGEREFRDFLLEYGIAAKRGQQHAGGHDSPDVISSLDDIVHWECKRVENFLLYPSLAQALEDARPEQTPVVVTKRNRGEWIAVLRAEDLLKLMIRVRSMPVQRTLDAIIAEATVPVQQTIEETRP